MRFRLTPDERKQRFREARKGWASTKGMGRGTFLDWRKQQYDRKMKAKEEAVQKQEDKRAKMEAERQRKEADKTLKTGKASTPSKAGRRLLLLIIIIIVAVITYFAIKYFSGQ